MNLIVFWLYLVSVSSQEKNELGVNKRSQKKLKTVLKARKQLENFFWYSALLIALKTRLRASYARFFL